VLRFANLDLSSPAKICAVRRSFWALFSFYSIEFLFGVVKVQTERYPRSLSGSCVGDVSNPRKFLRHLANTGQSHGFALRVERAESAVSWTLDSATATLKVSERLRLLLVDFVAPINSLKEGLIFPGAMVCTPFSSFLNVGCQDKVPVYKKGFKGFDVLFLLVGHCFSWGAFCIFQQFANVVDR
jgi:hypothetical protein